MGSFHSNLEVCMPAVGNIIKDEPDISSTGIHYYLFNECCFDLNIKIGAVLSLTL